MLPDGLIGFSFDLINLIETTSYLNKNYLKQTNDKTLGGKKAKLKIKN